MSQFDALLEAWAAGRRPLAPITALLGIEPVSWGEGESRVKMRADARHHNAMGTVHGGVFADLADVAMGVAVATTLAEGEGFTTLGLEAHYLKAVRDDDIEAHARVVERGRSSCYLECDVRRARDGALVARIHSRCMILKART